MDPIPPEQPPLVEPDRDAIALFKYFTKEFRGFLTHLEQAVNVYSQTGQVPDGPVYQVGITKAAFKRQLHEARGEPRRTRVARKPTPFNFFVKAKIQELRESGLQLAGDTNNNGLFRLAVEEWGKLSVAEKKAYTEDFKASHVMMGQDEADAMGHDGEDVDIEGEDPAIAAASAAKRRALLNTGTRKRQKMVAVPIQRTVEDAVLTQLEAATNGTGTGDMRLTLSELVSGGAPNLGAELEVQEADPEPAASEDAQLTEDVHVEDEDPQLTIPELDATLMLPTTVDMEAEPVSRKRGPGRPRSRA